MVKAYGRLIPAHAGKTEQPPNRPQPAPAHPRSRGENVAGVIEGDRHCGSSPLTRGKRARHSGLLYVSWLIPAHAGKTRPTRGCGWPSRAHPRSRGENARSLSCRAAIWGSSPLTRGKRVPLAWIGPRPRLIPAHAGKTPTVRRGVAQVPAHPRSRGENPPPNSHGWWGAGSSPLTRGKRINSPDD